MLFSDSTVKVILSFPGFLQKQSVYNFFPWNACEDSEEPKPDHTKRKTMAHNKIDQSLLEIFFLLQFLHLLVFQSTVLCFNCFIYTTV